MFIREENLPAIRILPMSDSDEFPNNTVEQVQQTFFLDVLSKRTSCDYLYRSTGMNAIKDTVVLFQFKGSIIAIAKLDYIEKFDTYLDNTYAGAYHFQEGSIAVMDPIDKNEMQQIWETFKRFSQSKQELAVDKWPLFFDLLQQKNIKYS